MKSLARTKTLVVACTLFLVRVGLAAVEEAPVSTFVGTAFHEGGWFSYKTDAYGDDGAVRLDAMAEYLRAPRYSSFIRKIVLKVRVSVADPTRFLRVVPFVNGVETADERLIHTLEKLQAADTSEYVTIDFSTTDQVDSFWVMLGGGSSKGNWGVEEIFVFYGAWQEEEDALLREFVGQLPAPANLRLGDFSETALELLADAVVGAAGYRFRVVRLDGTPLTTVREDFDLIADGFTLTEGWSIYSSNATLKACTEASDSSYIDQKGSTIKRALKIEKGKDATSPVKVEVVSQTVADAIVAYSFAARRYSGESSNAVSVYGRAGEEDDWQLLQADIPLQTSVTTVEGAVEAANGFRQLKFAFSAQFETFRPCGLDTLRVVYGGNGERTEVEDGTAVAESPLLRLEQLPTARYAYSVQAVGAALRDSNWSEEAVVDLQWATLSVTAPGNIRTSSVNGGLTAVWDPVGNAACYRVTIVSAEDPDVVVAEDACIAAPSFSTAVPAVGAYVIEITAVSPGGKSFASAQATCEVQLDRLGAVTLEAVDSQTIRATWKEIPLAEGYQVSLARLGGSAEKVELGWQGADGQVLLPDGWTAESSWGGKAWTSGEQVYPALDYTGCWLASGDRGRPITRLVCRYKCGSTAQAVLACSTLQVEVADAAGTWRLAEACAVTTKMAELGLDFAAADDVRQVRFSAASSDLRTMANVRLGVVSMTYGEESLTEVASRGVAKGDILFSDLDSAARYRVVVTPQPSDGGIGSSVDIDLSAEKFRKVGSLPISSLKGGRYAEDFSALAGVSGDTEARKCGLDYWQFYKASGEVERLLYTEGTNRTTSGVYVFGGEAGERMIGTLAASTTGCMVGLSFANDLDCPVALSSLSFDWIQRNRRDNASTNVLEYLIADGATGLGSSGDWTEISTGARLPATSGDEGEGEVIQHLEIAEGLPEKIPAGAVLTLRWRHEKVKSGPMMALDNVRADFSGGQKGAVLVVK